MAKNKITSLRTNLQRFLKKNYHLQSVMLVLTVFFLLTNCEQAEKQMPPPEIFLNQANNNMEVKIKDTIRIEPKITYDYKSRYEWRKNKEPIDYNGLKLKDVANEMGSFEYFFKVTTPSGSDSVALTIDVLVLADFQELTLQANQYWVGNTANPEFSDHNLSFPNANGNNDNWWGFGYANIFSTASVQPIKPYSAYSPSRDEEIFALVRHTEEANPPTLHFTDNKNHKFKSLEIANSTLGHYLMKYGTENFQRLGGPSGTNPDWCKVTITGLLSDNTVTGQIEFFLADYRFDNNKRDYILDNWEEIDLSGLGEVSKLQFNLTTSLTDDQQQMLSPELFCIDNLKILN